VQHVALLEGGAHGSVQPVLEVELVVPAHHVAKQVAEHGGVFREQGVEVDVVTIGQKASVFFRRIKVQMLASVTHVGDQPRIEQLIGVIKVMLDAYNAGVVDKVFLSYNDFVNTMTQRAAFDQLLPLAASETAIAHYDWDYIYEPDAQAVLEHVLSRYIESLVYQAVLENIASEHAARMVAMKSASDNASKLIDTLNLVYNKARQAAITQEISEIVGGAAAV